MEPSNTHVPTPHATIEELQNRLRRGDHGKLQGDCQAGSEVLARVGEKWTALVVVMLSGGPKRFKELQRMISGISQRMLTLTLRGLERDGLISRTVFPTVPPRVEYALTELGESLRAPIIALGNWAQANWKQIEAARERYDHSGVSEEAST
ncbi:putative HTH-type transcriptional regulator YybR [Gemmata sp. SH-PL17]|uniref:winged helix-turn-helix transcriptional regulator n=1 Tax=Gemmata sp. SH-PL17 TaxID=1630693 RepID=UPI0004AC788F|nr:helix-turn-helix domain-containing protein [Gemmata sp. SH-PL17]AMV29937.1 putative HTH-type transcriptional regulator YybR [Gemmata sp. SH-PL17]